jgi:hypothetical protein
MSLRYYSLIAVDPNRRRDKEMGQQQRQGTNNPKAICNFPFVIYLSYCLVQITFILFFLYFLYCILIFLTVSVPLSISVTNSH